MYREGRLCGGQGHWGTCRSRQEAEAREGPLALGGTHLTAPWWGPPTLIHTEREAGL